jgi:hypothetical protein
MAGMISSEMIDVNIIEDEDEVGCDGKRQSLGDESVIVGSGRIKPKEMKGSYLNTAINSSQKFIVADALAGEFNCLKLIGSHEHGRNVSSELATADNSQKDSGVGNGSGGGGYSVPLTENVEPNDEQNGS